MAIQGGGIEVPKATVDRSRLNPAADLPYSLRIDDFAAAMQDIYDLLFDLNGAMLSRGLGRFDDMLRPAGMSGLISDAITESLAKHSRGMAVNQYHNGHPDLIVAGVYANNAVEAGEQGVEIKTTRGRSLAVDSHGAREQWLCVFRYEVDTDTEPKIDRSPTRFVEVGLAHLTLDDFRENVRTRLGTDTASPNARGVQKLRENWVYRAE